MARGGPLVPALIGIVVHAIGRNGWWSHLDRLDAAECHAAIARLERIQVSRIRADATMTEEKYCGQIMLRNTRPSWVFFWISRRKTMSNYVEMMDAHIANARKPYLKATPVVTPSDHQDSGAGFYACQMEFCAQRCGKFAVAGGFGAARLQTGKGCVSAEFERIVAEVFEKYPC